MIEPSHKEFKKTQCIITKMSKYIQPVPTSIVNVYSVLDNMHYTIVPLLLVWKGREGQKFIKRGICFKCLNVGHSLKDCKSNSTCRTFKKRHHTLLHRFCKPSNTNSSPQAYLGHSGATSNSQCGSILLPTANVGIQSSSEKVLSFSALLDSSF